MKLSNRRYDILPLSQPEIRANLGREHDKMCQENNPAEENTSNEFWNELEFNIQVATENIIKQPWKTKTKYWMTVEIMQLMNERRLLKNVPDRYREVDTITRRKIKEVKKKWTQEQYDEAPRLHRLHDLFNFNKKVKETTGAGRKTSIKMIKNEQR
ncbi:hypothetical protein HHI36_002206 [Cryptolaemus montrouzieri]|uniref:Uncharacterized protein n=1 Tax=Cryptolaemus montrouzieri TaxID=559131 RepID=A0ABD2PAL0_9CUCU